MVAQKFNYAEFYALLNKLPSAGKDKDAHKGLLVMQYTGGRTLSLKKMTTTEYRKMCSDMRAHVDGKTSSGKYEATRRKARSELLHWLQRYGVDTSDWDAVNAFCLSKKIAGKTFGRMSVDELRDTKKRVLAMCSKEGKDKKRK